MKPVLKWVGGKTQLLPVIHENMPKNFNNYFEPFFGGGALGFTIEKTEKRTLYFSDLNKEIINMYKTLRKSPYKVAKQIEDFKIEYNKNPQHFFYYLRNRDKEINFWNQTSKVYQAARTIFLNKTCFNGLFRVNSSGFFNTPWNQKSESPNIYEIENFKEISKFLKKINLSVNNYKYLIKKVEKGDFVYLDPPYDKLNKETFTSYNKFDFGIKEQMELSEFCKKLNEKGAYFMLSNHDTDLIKKIYSEFNIRIVKANRNINSNGKARQKINEVLITNY
ncbi:DNA adenine methylase [Mesoplasma coleopterae]|uniref:DNA adenine methylase n=1 Tax=Mesoplasma coleopterae TaxID=324078 RepID=UPI000D035C44|nr:Dam family site-specific DNA-(adenine-N6)-methyltransferase [Mesoplasma coleopterae]AVN63018.1 modification methylase [Mesoplasma coleopterae]